MWKSRIAVGALLVVAVTGAAGATVDDASTAAGTVANALRAFDNALHTLWGNPLRNIGIKLLAAITAAIACWTILKAMFMQGSTQSLLGELMQLALVASVAGAIFGAWPGTFWIKDISESILWVGNQISNGVRNDGFDTTLTLASLQNQRGDGPELTILNKMFVAAFDTWEIDTKDGGLLKMLETPISSFGRFLIGVAGKIITSLMLVVAGTIAVGTIVVAKVALACGIALAPVLVPWVLLPATKDIFGHWLGFVNSTTFTVVFLQLFSSIAQLAVKEFDTIAKGTNTLTGDFALYMVLIMVASLIVFLMLQAGSWARALVPGGVAVGVAGLLAPAAMTTKAVGAAGGMANRAAGAGFNAARSTAGHVKLGAAMAKGDVEAARTAQAWIDRSRATPHKTLTSKMGGKAREGAKHLAHGIGYGVNTRRRS